MYTPDMTLVEYLVMILNFKVERRDNSSKHIDCIGYLQNKIVDEA